MSVCHQSPALEKVSLFRSLFAGRTEAYPIRFVSKKTGKPGNSPACGNEWVRGICDKPRTKCGDCAYQKWLPVTDEVIHRHLAGEITIGVYPMLLDETCRFLAVDFDDDGWAEDALAFLETCRMKNLPAALERSRSGNGGHIWLFFSEAIPASLARRLGTHILTETTARRPQTKLASYDRFFPNQDTLPRGGFGNLIALPLQKGPRAEGNSVFIDETLTPFPDQWSHLDSLQRISKQQAGDLVETAQSHGSLIGVRMAPTEEDDGAEPWKSPPSRQHPARPSGKMPLPASRPF